MSGALGTWIDGAAGTTVPVDDRGLQYGDGLFETVLVRAGRPRFLDAHIARLGLGLAALKIPFDFETALRAEIAQAGTSAPPLAVLKIVVTRGSALRRGYAPQDARPRRILSLWPAGPTPTEAVALGLASLRVAAFSPFAGLKHLNRLENVMAAADRGAGCFDVIMCDVNGHVVSASAANVFCVRNGGLVTPRVDRRGVAGVVRSIVLREASRLEIPAHEAELTLADLQSADGVFITNARIGVVPVSRVGEHAVTMSPLTSRLSAHVEALDA
jgi:4-amino-4-deoxychorismate lyase